MSEPTTRQLKVHYIDPAPVAPPSASSTTPLTAINGQGLDLDFVFPSSQPPDGPDTPSNRGGDFSPTSPTTAVNFGSPTHHKLGSRTLEALHGEGALKHYRTLDAALAAELIVAAEARHNRSVSTNSSQSARSSSSTSSSVLNQKVAKLRRYGLGLANYDLLSSIGGVEDVSFLFYARHRPTGEDVALKYTDLNISTNEELLDSLIASVRNAAMCQHEYILPYLCSYLEEGCLWTVMPPMRAGSCRSLLEEHFPTGFGYVAVATIIRKVLLALSYLHENLMIHNDIRAANILMDITGEIRVTGLHSVAHLTESGQRLNSVYSPVGSNFEWAAPEIIGQGELHDERADIYSIGITALELAFNRTPFDDWPPLKILLSKLKYPWPQFTPPKEMPSDFFDFVEQCLQRDPTKRPPARQLLNHFFLRNAKGKAHLEKHIVRPTGIKERHEKAVKDHKNESRNLSSSTTSASDSARST